MFVIRLKISTTVSSSTVPFTLHVRKWIVNITLRCNDVIYLHLASLSCLHFCTNHHSTCYMVFEWTYLMITSYYLDCFTPRPAPLEPKGIPRISPYPGPYHIRHQCVLLCSAEVTNELYSFHVAQIDTRAQVFSKLDSLHVRSRSFFSSIHVYVRYLLPCSHILVHTIQSLFHTRMTDMYVIRNISTWSCCYCYYRSYILSVGKYYYCFNCEYFVKYVMHLFISWINIF